jgi:hypothetical protein
MKTKMKTGSEMTIRNLPETFYILLLGFDAILRRFGIKDAVHFKNHNSAIQLNADLFASAVCFNLFSEYGVGKRLEPLIFELFKTLELDPDIHEENIFFQEIVKESNKIAPIIRRADSKEEAKWSYDYAISSLFKNDALNIERMERLSSLFDIDVKENTEVLILQYSFADDEDSSENEDSQAENEHDVLNVEDDVKNEVDLSDEVDVRYDEDVLSDEVDEEETDEEEDDEKEGDDVIEIENCDCGFCNEFRKYHYPREESVERIILNTLMEIDDLATK